MPAELSIENFLYYQSKLKSDALPLLCQLHQYPGAVAHTSLLSKTALSIKNQLL